MKNEEENENKEINFKSLEIKEVNNNIDIDNDKETDDILAKLEVSHTSDSFDTPIILNRTKAIYEESILESFMNDSKILNNDVYILKNKVEKRKKKTKSSLDETFTCKKENKSLTNFKDKYNNKNIYSFNQEFHKRNLNKNFSTLYRNNTYNNIFNHSNDFSINKDNYKKLPSIDEKIVRNKNNNKKDKKIENINKKMEDIILLIKNMKFIDKKLKKKDFCKIMNNCLLENKEINIDNIFESISELLDYILEILNSSQNYNIKNDNKLGNEKIILKLQKEIKEKDKVIGELLNKMNLEKDKYKNSFNLKKQNKELNNKIDNMQKQISKLEKNNGELHEKLNKINLEKSKKQIMNSSRRYSFVIHNFSKIEPPILEVNNTSQNGPIINEQNKNNNILNDKYRKINLFLIDLLKEINNILIYYDTFINKECGVIKNNQNVAKNLINFMDINDLIEEKKMKMIANEFKRNMDIIFTKIEEYIKEVNKKKIVQK